jgi:hypothetical protein
MVGAQTAQESKETFLTQLKEHARRQDVPIDETVWEQPVQADTPKLTVVSHHKAYIVSVQPTDLTDPQCGAEVIGLLVTIIKHNLPYLQVRRQTETPQDGVSCWR